MNNEILYASILLLLCVFELVKEFYDDEWNKWKEVYYDEWYVYNIIPI